MKPFLYQLYKQLLFQYLGNIILPITSQNGTSFSEDHFHLLSLYKEFMLMDDPSSPVYYKVVEDTTPISMDGNNGDTILLSTIDKDSSTAQSVLNLTRTNYGDKDYDFDFTSGPQDYDENEKLFNLRLNSIKFLK